MNTAVLLYMVGRCVWWVGAWVAGVLYLCCTAVVLLYVVGAFDLRPPVVLQRTKSKNCCCVSTCFILSYSCGYLLGAVLSFCSNSYRVSYHVCIEVKTPGTPGDGVWYLEYDV